MAKETQNKANVSVCELFKMHTFTLMC